MKPVLNMLAQGRSMRIPVHEFRGRYRPMIPGLNMVQ
jgi:hypothetical protein